MIPVYSDEEQAIPPGPAAKNTKEHPMPPSIRIVLHIIGFAREHRHPDDCRSGRSRENWEKIARRMPVPKAFSQRKRERAAQTQG